MCQCGVRCKRTNYDMSVSSTGIPNHGSVQEFESSWKKNKSYVERNMLTLVVFMRDSYAEKHVESLVYSKTNVLSE